MIRGLYTSGLGMTVQMKRLDVVSNNIANADTTGFKRDGAVTRTFSEEYLKRINDPNRNRTTLSGRIGRISQGLFVDDVFTDFSSGSMRVTNGALDVSLSGGGFFAVRDAAGNERYTRDGAFTLTPEGRLVTKDGFSVLDTDGNPITLPNGEISINENGGITVAGEQAAALRLVSFNNPESLRKQGANLYAATPESDPAAALPLVQQGMLENSNVNAVKEMVEVINISRIYELNQRMVQSADTVMSHIANDIAKR